MFICYFKNMITGEEFKKQFTSPYLMQRFLTKCRYSKKIRHLGTEKWG